MRPLILVATLLLVCGPAAADRYRVTLDRENLRLARVEASVTPGPGGELLLTRDASDSGLEGGWAGFLEHLEVMDSTGNALAFESTSPGVFRLAAPATGPVRVRYAMRLEHDRVENLPGADELAWARPESVLWTGRALFLEGAPGAPVEIEFELPDGWKATTPWRVLETGRRFRAESIDDLLDSAFIAGEHYEARLGGGPDANVRIALAGEQATSRSDTIVATVERYLDTFTRLFGSPPGGRLLLVAADGGFWGGGVMGTTISMMVGGVLDESTLPVLRFVTVHELFHLWNANFTFAPDGGLESLYWMTEGTASYYTMRSQLGHNELSEEAVLRQLEDEITKYLAARSDLSLVAAGAQKLHHYDLIYSGGFAASLVLDAEIRSRSGGRSSLDDVMRALGSGSYRDTPLDVTSFATVVESTTGVDVRTLVDRCIARPDALPLVDAFAALGLELVLGDGRPPRLRRAVGADELWISWPLQ